MSSPSSSTTRNRPFPPHAAIAADASDPALLDPRVRRYVLPQRVVWQNNGVRDAALLLRNDWSQALAQAIPACALHGEAGVLLDFGRELHGGVQLVTGPLRDNKPVRVRLRFGESVSEAMGQPNNDHAMHDQIVQLPPMSSQEFGLTGFRFVRLDLLDADDELPLVACRAVTLMRPAERVGSFRCSDERLNRIWEVGADTLHLCMQDLLWDGIKRDRLVWMGDLHPEISVISAVWGAHDIVPASLDWVRDHTPLPQWMNGISSYSMWWLIIQRDWYWQHGNLPYLETQREYLVPLLDIFCGLVRDEGTAELTDFLFLDWPSSNNPAAVRSGLHALLVMALRAGAEMCAFLGISATQEKCVQKAAVLAGHAPDLLPASKQASSLLALAGLHTAQEANQQVLAVNPLRGLSTFYGYYVLQARAAAGDHAGCLEVIRRYWGAMLDLGATTFWEDFDLSWAENAGRIDELTPPGKHDAHAEYGDYCYKGLRHSLCHGWAAGPTAWLAEHVLGVRPTRPGCASVEIKPHLGDLAWAEGTYPTPHGLVIVRHERDALGEIKSTIKAPDPIRLTA